MQARAIASLGLSFALLAGCRGAAEPPAPLGSAAAERVASPSLSAPSAESPGPSGASPSVSASPSTAPSAVPSASADPSPSPSASPGSPALPPASPVTAPPVEPSPPASLPRVAVASRDGIRFRVELQRNPLPAGEPSWVRITVTNTGRNDVTWFHDGCAQAAWVGGRSQVAWPEGLRLAPQAQMFKQYALGTYNGQPLPAAWMAFVPKRLLGKGSYACADIGLADRIAPGERLRQTMWWSGYTDVNRSLAPTGPARIKASASSYWRGHEEPANIADQSFDLELDAWITGGTGAGRLSPAEVVDAAVADPDFAAYLETQELANGREEIAWYDAETDTWEVGVMPWYETTPPRIHGVLVHPVTGAILGTLDRPWDEEADGFP